jgi:leucyl-tRNA synthetase
MGPLERQKPWQTAGIEGLWRFLNKAWRSVVGDDRVQVRIADDAPSAHLAKRMHQTIKKVTEDIDGLRFNTAISQLMIFTSDMQEELDKAGATSRQAAEVLVKLVAPFSPHIAEEMWEILGHKESLTYAPWPAWDEAMTVENTVNVVFQTNGKVRVEHAVAKGTAKDALEAMARGHEKFQAYLEGADIVKVIVVPDKLVNFVLKPR